VRLMYDSTNPLDIPVGVPMVAGYVDGDYAWSTFGWLAHLSSVRVRIACFAGTNDGHVLDVEAGCATIPEAVGWVLMRRAAGADPSVYISESKAQALYDAFGARGVPIPWLWGAWWDGVADLPFGWKAKQYANPAITGRHYDLSAVEDYWPGVDAAPTVPPPWQPPATVDDAFALAQVVVADAGNSVWTSIGGLNAAAARLRGLG
jgi:hypothetical protein